jgi:1-acyl-sn-glycerol-3-phosphate acyltransferase
MHGAYRMQKTGLEHIPLDGPAALVCNHVSFVDVLAIMAASPRPVCFILDRRYFRMPLLGYLLRRSGAVGLAFDAPPSEVEESMTQVLNEAAKTLADGRLLALFPETTLTPDGEIQPFGPLLSRILERSPVPVIPMALQGLWGSFFSRIDGGAMRRPFRRGLFSRIGLAAGAPIDAAEATPARLRAEVTRLRGDWR